MKHFTKLPKTHDAETGKRVNTAAGQGVITKTYGRTHPHKHKYHEVKLDNGRVTTYPATEVTVF